MMNVIATLSLLNLGFWTASLSYGSPIAVVPNWSTEQIVHFYEDARPRDGDLIELILTKNSSASFDLSRHSVTAGFPPPVLESTEHLGYGLACANSTFNAEGRLTTIVCKRDGDPVDSKFVAFVFSLRTDALYDAYRITVDLDSGGMQAPLTTKIGSKLILEILK